MSELSLHLNIQDANKSKKSPPAQVDSNFAHKEQALNNISKLLKKKVFEKISIIFL